MKWVKYYENTKVNPYIDLIKNNAKGGTFQSGGSISNSASRFMVPIGNTTPEHDQSGKVSVEMISPVQQTIDPS